MDDTIMRLVYSKGYEDAKAGRPHDSGEVIGLGDKLRPCPFCGSEDIYVTLETGYIDDSVVVFCNTCKVSLKLEDNDQEGDSTYSRIRAVKAWNRRSSC